MIINNEKNLNAIKLEHKYGKIIKCNFKLIKTNFNRFNRVKVTEGCDKCGLFNKHVFIFPIYGLNIN